MDEDKDKSIIIRDLRCLRINTVLIILFTIGFFVSTVLFIFNITNCETMERKVEYNKGQGLIKLVDGIYITQLLFLIALFIYFTKMILFYR